MLLDKYAIIGFSEFYGTEIMETKFYCCTPPRETLLEKTFIYCKIVHPVMSHDKCSHGGWWARDAEPVIAYLALVIWLPDVNVFC